MNKINILFAAGGTGGHLFPAVAVAEEIHKLTNGNANLIFIGTEYRMESKLVPELGYQYISMPIIPFPGISLKASTFLKNLIQSYSISRHALKSFKIDAVVCAGAYISFPPAKAASKLGIPVYLMESNVNIGKSNKMLLKDSKYIFTSFQETKAIDKPQYNNKIKFTGNPLRQNLFQKQNVNEFFNSYNFDKNLRTILIMGGSLGANSINTAIEKNIELLSHSYFNILWQTGSSYSNFGKINLPNNIKQVQFINNMSLVYQSVDFIICRSGASTVSEIAALGKPSMLIPLPSASNNEQLLNAKVMVEHNAAILCYNNEIESQLQYLFSNTLNDLDKLKAMSANALKLAKPDAANVIAKIIIDDFNNKKS